MHFGTSPAYGGAAKTLTASRVPTFEKDKGAKKEKTPAVLVPSHGHSP